MVGGNRNRLLLLGALVLSTAPNFYFLQQINAYSLNGPFPVSSTL
ncbi:hypothetical protein ACFQT0_30340 [Hymenobacter humi]|uniref:Uncharacterized protein n=1 Tax=Hymenobacter humi TaxID=1411620 RepID=A0ABW2UCR1_9BACT